VKPEVWFVYLARCADGTLYCGVAKDVAARLAQHDAGKGARYTRGRGPLALLAKRRCASHGEALRLELAVKALTRDEKERLTNTRRFRALSSRISADREDATSV
jgi:putative endonuclease